MPISAEYMRLNPLPVPVPLWPETEHFRARQKLFRPVARRLLRERGDFLGLPLRDSGPLVGAVGGYRYFHLVH